MAVETNQTSSVFNLKTPYLLQGITTDPVAVTDGLTVMIKVYAAGGENRMHSHMNEDHSFIVLEGQATFHLETDENTRVVGRYEGVMLPRGANYCFENSGEGNLVMLRVGANYGDAHTGVSYPDGTAKSPSLEPYIHLEPIPAPGPGFAADAS
jgi:mannose-6-phosphate isomerase-like protein (cupin superfamily)